MDSLSRTTRNWGLALAVAVITFMLGRVLLPANGQHRRDATMTSGAWTRPASGQPAANSRAPVASPTPALQPQPNLGLRPAAPSTVAVSVVDPPRRKQRPLEKKTAATKAPPPRNQAVDEEAPQQPPAASATAGNGPTTAPEPETLPSPSD